MTDKPIGSLAVGDRTLQVVQPDISGHGLFIRSLHARDEEGNTVALISWYGDGRISNVRTDPDYQRRGVATRLFEMARRIEPGLRHNLENMTGEGLAWAKTIREGW